MKRPSSITAIVAMTALVVLSVSLCCAVAMPAHASGCCKGRCVSVSAAGPLVAIAPAKFLALTAVPSRNVRVDGESPVLTAVDPTCSKLFRPIATIQLRI